MAFWPLLSKPSPVIGYALDCQDGMGSMQLHLMENDERGLILFAYKTGLGGDTLQCQFAIWEPWVCVTVQKLVLAKFCR